MPGGFVRPGVAGSDMSSACCAASWKETGFGLGSLLCVRLFALLIQVVLTAVSSLQHFVSSTLSLAGAVLGAHTSHPTTFTLSPGKTVPYMHVAMPHYLYSFSGWDIPSCWYSSVLLVSLGGNSLRVCSLVSECSRGLSQLLGQSLHGGGGMCI